MKRIIFDDYINPERKVIPFLYLLYIMAIPLAILLIKLRFKPNTITTLSNVSALISYYLILIEDAYLLFSFFWILALFFDISDGIVSRKTKKSSPQGSFYDHFTDQIKIILLFLSAGLYYDSTSVWILSFLCSTIFLLRALLLYMMKYRSKILLLASKDSSEIKKKLNNSLLILVKKYFYNNLFLIMGQFNILLIFIFIKDIHIHVFILILFIILLNLINELKKMNSINNKLQDNNLKWS